MLGLFLKFKDRIQIFYLNKGLVYGDNATFNNISVISWLPVLLVEETGVPGENH
jgi:hypothetical protein